MWAQRQICACPSFMQPRSLCHASSMRLCPPRPVRRRRLRLSPHLSLRLPLRLPLRLRLHPRSCHPRVRCRALLHRHPPHRSRMPNPRCESHTDHDLDLALGAAARRGVVRDVALRTVGRAHEANLWARRSDVPAVLAEVAHARHHHAAGRRKENSPAPGRALVAAVSRTRPRSRRGTDGPGVRRGRRIASLCARRSRPATADVCPRTAIRAREHREYLLLH